MKKSLVLALALVFGVASASMAATPTVSGNVTVEVKGDSFSGPYTVSPEATLDIDFAESGDNWSLDARLKAEWSDSSDPAVDVSLDRYKGVFKTEFLTATLSRAYDLGNIDTPFRWIRLVGKAGDTVDQLRLEANASGVQIHSQVVGPTANALQLRVQTTVDNVTMGAAAELGLGSSAKSNYAIYGTTKFGIVEAKAIYGAFPATSYMDDKGHYGIDIGAQVTEALNIGASYSDVTYPQDKGNPVSGGSREGYGLRATFQEGLIQARANYWELQKNTSLWFKYRGSADNQAFGDLFEGDPWKSDPWKEKWYNNVAPAFGVNYATKEGDDATVKLFGVAPLTSNAIARAEVESKSGQSGFLAEARFSLDEKTVLNPFVDKDRTKNDTKFGARVFYTVSDNAEIYAWAWQEGNTQEIRAGFSVDF
ncbi:MAG: hypothetical protein BAA04_02695 [Firmicutes bacterium ZCTH02-B6]|nr:MAG: hypothetical protein BAA04_02695 [Firmicutes bacterium ZCTH02-B6]